jgi:hypothetical protein
MGKGKTMMPPPPPSSSVPPLSTRSDRTFWKKYSRGTGINLLGGLLGLAWASPVVEHHAFLIFSNIVIPVTRDL